MMTNDASWGVLRVAENGQVVAMNGVAREILGDAQLPYCDEVVRASHPDGAALCRSGCVSALGQDGCNSTGVRKVRVRGRQMELECHRLGDEVVVVFSPGEGKGDAAAISLSPRERDVLRLVAAGQTTGNIAESLGLSESTVRTHVENARRRLSARSRAEAVGKAMALGQI